MTCFVFPSRSYLACAQLIWRPVAQAAVRPDASVLIPPGTDFFVASARLRNQRASRHSSGTAAEAFKMAVLDALSGLNVDQFDRPFFAAAQEVPAGEFRAVVTDQRLRCSPRFSDLLENARGAPAAESCVRLQREASRVNASTTARMRSRRKPVAGASDTKSSAHCWFARTRSLDDTGTRVSRLRFSRCTATPSLLESRYTRLWHSPCGPSSPAARAVAGIRTAASGAPRPATLRAVAHSGPIAVRAVIYCDPSQRACMPGVR